MLRGLNVRLIFYKAQNEKRPSNLGRPKLASKKKPLSPSGNNEWLTGS